MSHVQVDPDDLDAASSAMGRAVTDVRDSSWTPSGADYGHAELASAFGAFRDEVGIAVEQMMLKIDLLSDELASQADSYREADADVSRRLSPSASSAAVPGNGHSANRQVAAHGRVG